MGSLIIASTLIVLIANKSVEFSIDKSMP
jgi:hypothetical protein